MNVIVVDILTKIFLTLLTSIALFILLKISICRRWFLFGVIYYVTFQFTPWSVSVDNNMVSKIWVGMSTINILLLLFKIQGRFQMWTLNSSTSELIP